MRNVMLAVAASALIASGMSALADYDYSDGITCTPCKVFSFVQSGTNKLLSSFVIIDSTGTEKATSGNPLRIDPVGTTTQPVNCVSGCSAGSGTAANNADSVAPVSTGLGAAQDFPFLYNGSTFDRWYGDKTNGAWVNIKSAVALPVTGTFWQATQPVSATSWPLPTGAATQATLASILSQLQAPASTPVTGTFWQSTQPVSIASMPTTPVTGTFWQSTQPVSAASWPLPTGAATQATLASILSQLQAPASTPVTGTFWQTTQPVSAASLPLPTNAAQETGGNLASTATNTGTTATNTTAANTNLGAPGATACASDTGSCSLNALLQRIAQRLTSGIITPGQTTRSSSVPVTAASDQIVGSPSTAVVGSYCMALTSGTMAAGLAAGSPILSFRYGGSGLALIRKIRLSVGDTSTAFAAGVFAFSTFVARSFSASDSGGNAATLTGNNGKMRTLFASTAISDFRVSSTAALTAGTRTLDTTALGTLNSSVPATAGSPPLAPAYLLQPDIGEQPLQLATNEGFEVEATVPATGTWTFSGQVCWDEVASY
jgi:hypothetical protein